MSAIVTSMIYTLHGFNSVTEDCCQTLARVKMLQYGKPNHFCVGNDEKQMPPQKSSHLDDNDCGGKSP
jgi:hypothetical protein